MKKTLSIILAALLSLTLLAGCGEKKDDKTVTVAASTTPHALILEQCKDALEEKGYTLVIKTMDDYVTPNTATESGDVDANYFQHQPYLDKFNEENSTHLASVAKLHYEPFGIYAGTSASLAEIPDGAKIAVPNDTTNEARALLLLDANGLIKLKDNTDLTATKNDIAENPHNYDIVEMEAALLPSLLDEVAVAVINGNYAIGAGLKVSDALAAEDEESVAAQTYGNVLVVKEGNENEEKIKALVEVLKSEAISKYITDSFDGAVLPLS